MKLQIYMIENLESGHRIFAFHPIVSGSVLEGTVGINETGSARSQPWKAMIVDVPDGCEIVGGDVFAKLILPGGESLSARSVVDRIKARFPGFSGNI